MDAAAANGIQLEMNFEGAGGNRFKELLDTGTFFVLVEVAAPSCESKVKDAASRVSDLEFAVSAQKSLPAGLAFTDKLRGLDSINVVEFASALCKSSRDSHLIYLSGRDSSLQSMSDALALCRSEGFKSVAPVSGDAIKGDTLKQTRARSFVESVHLLKQNAEAKRPLFAGCAVNPFKYTPGDCFNQYFKLFKKIKCGASFAVSQYGWDMLKLQELRWNLTRRGFLIPSIARMLLLTPEKVEEICSGKCPGVHISPDFQSALRKETMHSMAQFEAAQWRRLQIHVAGARLLGYSGVQIAGIERADQAQIAIKRIAEALSEFQSFEEWREAYREYYARLEMAPYPHRFYMFEGLFAKAHSDDESPKMQDAPIPLCSDGEKFRYKLSKSLFSRSDALPASERRLTKKLIAGCRSCQLCRLPQTFFVCPESCPKGLGNGPCGGSRANGDCELGGFECIHARRIRLAAWLKDFGPLEDIYVPYAASKARS